MKEADTFSQAQCPVCKKEFDRGMIQEKHIDRWEYFLQIESGALGFMSTAKTEGKKKQCTHCKNEFPMRELMVDSCGHEHCENCLRKMMKESSKGDKEKVKCAQCGSPFEYYILESVDPKVYTEYTKALESKPKN